MTDFAFLHSNHFSHCTARVNKHFDGYWTLQFMSQGGVELFYDQTRHEMTGEWFWTAFPGPHIRFHKAREHEFWEHRYAAFQGERIKRWSEDGLWPKVPQIAPFEENWAMRFDEMLRYARQIDNISVLRGAHLLEGILLDLAAARQMKTEVPRRNDWLETVLKELRHTNEFAPNYALLAKRSNVGLSTLRRRFREEMGTPLHDFVVQNRIARARHLLGESDLPIKALAAKLGYSDVYFFAAQFRRVTGTTPAAYRKSRQK